MSVSVFSVESGPNLDAVRTLFREYQASLDIDLRGFPAELAMLPDKYAAPTGALFLAHGASGEALGCVGVRPYERPGACEMKRLYVRQAGRGSGAGRALADAAISFARAAGYAEMLLDTYPSMMAAIGLYGALGFQRVPPYRPDAPPELMFFRKDLRRE